MIQCSSCGIVQVVCSLTQRNLKNYTDNNRAVWLREELKIRCLTKSHIIRCNANKGEEVNDNPVSRREQLLGVTGCGCAFCSSRGWYDKIFAYGLAHCCSDYLDSLEPIKQELFSQMKYTDLTNILEIGIGTGPNLKFYAKGHDNVKVTGLDPNTFMKQYLLETANSLEIKEINFVEGYAENIPFEDHTFDFLISTTVLCSVSDVDRCLTEIRRVLKPGGKFIFLEHVRGPPNTTQTFFQDFLNPLQRAVAGGCNLNRDILSNIKLASFSKLNSNNVQLNLIKIISSHIYGIAEA